MNDWEYEEEQFAPCPDDEYERYVADSYESLHYAFEEFIEEFSMRNTYLKNKKDKIRKSIYGSLKLVEGEEEQK